MRGKRIIAPDGQGARVVVLARHYPPEYTGAGLQLAALIERLHRRGVRFTVLAPAWGPVPSLPGEGVTSPRVVRFQTPASDPFRSLVFGLRATLWMLLHPRWDLLHAIDFSFESLGPWALARFLRRPVLVKTTLLEEGGGGSLGARLLRLVRGVGYRGADTVIALSDALEETLREQFGRRSGIARIPNGVDTERFHPANDGERLALRKEFGIPKGAFVTVLSGMRIRRKNGLGLIAAAARMQHRPVHVLLLGPPGDDAAYETRIRDAIGALPGGVTATLMGEKPSGELARVLRAADAYVLPSRSEGLPNSLLEGMASGLACVATDIPGSHDVLAGGGGLLVPLDDEQALADALDRVAGDADLRQRLGAKALQVIEFRYALDRVAELYGAAYATLLGARPASDAEENG